MDISTNLKNPPRWKFLGEKKENMSQEKRMVVLHHHHHHHRCCFSYHQYNYCSSPSGSSPLSDYNTTWRLKSSVIRCCVIWQEVCNTSRDRTAFTSMALQSFGMLANYHPLTQCHIPADPSPWQHHYENLKSRKKF
jgi:hypothetical protein